MSSIIILFRHHITYKEWTSPVLQRVKNLRHAKGFSFFLANCLHCQWRGAPSGGRNSVQREKEKCVSVFTWVRLCVRVCVCLSFKYFNFVSNSLRAAAATTTLMIVSQPCWHFNFTLCFISTFSYTHTHMYVGMCMYIFYALFCSSLLFSSLLLLLALLFCFQLRLLLRCALSHVCLFICPPDCLTHASSSSLLYSLTPLPPPSSPLSVTSPSSVSISV